MKNEVSEKVEKPKLLKRTKSIDLKTEKVEDPDPEVMTVEEVSKFLRVTPRAVYHLVRDKKIPALMVGTKFRFYRKAVLDALSKIPE